MLLGGVNFLIAIRTTVRCLVLSFNLSLRSKGPWRLTYVKQAFVQSGTELWQDSKSER